jgi:two-component system, chemotaxis family, sensor kinase CheA
MRDVLNIHGLLTEGLREKILQLRMMPLSSAVETFPRLVRDLSLSSGKEVEFFLEGVDTEMDKLVIEKIGDPLLHMIRNSVDHGIERPEEREKKGKPRKGTIKVSAGYEGGNVHIKISDDGGGIPLDSIKEKAMQRNLRHKEELSNMSDAEIANLIFEPGFSTSAIITDISGRGVGMDVVKGNIVEQLKGSIQTETTPDEGTCFTIRVPLTLTVMRILLFSVSQTIFGFPISSIREIIRVQKSEIIEVVNKKAIRLRDQIIPITDLKKIIKLPESEEREDAVILILAMGNEMIGVMIDSLISEEDMEVKPLPSHMRNSDLASGATITGKGDVVILLHVPKIMEKSKMHHEGKKINRPIKKEKQRILVVEDSVSTREIEKSILESYGYQVDIASDGIEGLEKTQKVKYDLVLSDIEMPRLDGFSLVEKLRSTEDYKHTPIIIVSSRDREEDKRRGIEVGADAYIIKGNFDQSNLIATVQNLI